MNYLAALNIEEKQAVNLSRQSFGAYLKDDLLVMLNF